MIEVRKTSLFVTWLANLGDPNAKGRIVSRISRLEHGNPGDVRPVGGGISEMRIGYGPGYRVYYLLTWRDPGHSLMRRRQEKPRLGHQESQGAGEGNLTETDKCP